jgi:hypothetical protein
VVVAIHSLQTWQPTAALATSTTLEKLFRARDVELAPTVTPSTHERHTHDIVSANTGPACRVEARGIAGISVEAFLALRARRKEDGDDDAPSELRNKVGPK